MRFFRTPRVTPVTLSACCNAMGYESNGVAHCVECWDAAPGVSIPAPVPCDECGQITGHTPACGW